MYRGRKVTDPVPKVRGTEIYDSSLTDLAKAWDTVGKTRSELRKLQYRLGETQRVPLGVGLNETGEASITDYSAFSLGTNQTYNLPSTGRQFPSGATVDNQGWSKHVRAQKAQIPGARQISHLEDNFMEHPNRQPGHHVTSKSGSDRSRAPLDLPNRDPGFDRNAQRAASPKRVDFSNQLELRKINPDGTYTDSFALGEGASAYSAYNPGLNSDPLLSHDTHSYSQSTLTDSKALRETEIRFLNNQRYNPQTFESRPDAYDVRWNKISSRLTHVDVNVPGATNYRSTARQALNGAASVPGGAVGRDRGGHSDIQKHDGYSSTTSEGSESGNGKGIKKHLKDFDRDTGALAKLKEKIRQQRLATAAASAKGEKDPVAREDNPLETEPPPQLGGVGSVNDITHRLHGNSDPVEALGAMPVWENDRVSAAVVRKVAAGPPPPVYKGFNEAESRYKLVKRLEGSRKPNRKKPQIHIQEKRKDENDEFREPKHPDKPRRRVVAHRDKPSKPKPKDVITTSSWRSGQQVILQTLGPRKSSRPSKSAGAKSSSDTDVETKVNEETNSQRPETLGGAEQRKDDVSKILSEEARKVLTDLHIGQEDGGKMPGAKKDGESDKPKKPAVKRKAPKPQEAEKQQPATKSRHYDADAVRQYIAKQKEERLRRKREEQETRARLEAERRKQLEELSKKTKPSANQRKPMRPATSKSKQSSEPVAKTVAWEEGSSKAMLVEDKIKRLLGSESDKENKDVLELSDSSSTLTNDDSVGDSTPVATPRGEQLDRGKDSRPGYSFVPGEVETQIGRAGLYSTHSHDSLRQRGPGVGTTEPRGGLPLTSSAPPSDLGLFSASGQYRTRAERIQAIKDTAATLQSRLQADAQRLTESGPTRQASSLPGPSSQPSALKSRWASVSAQGASRAPEGDVEPTRHERIAGINDDFTVFRSNLPGVESLSSHLQRVEQNRAQDSAATRIQSAYRGQAVRQTLDWKLPSGKSVGSKIRGAGRVRKERYQDSDESSTFSDITITDDSEVESLASPPKKIGSGLLGRDYHPGDKYRQEVLEQNRAERDPLPQTKTWAPAIHWDKPEADPYSTLNVFTRKYQQTERERLKPAGLPVTSDPVRERLQATDAAYETQRAGEVPPHGWRSPVGLRETVKEAETRRSETRHVETSGRPASALDVARTDDVRSRLASASFHPTQDSDHEDKEEDVTIEGDDSYTQSFDSDHDPVAQSYGNQVESVVKETTRSHEVRHAFPSSRQEDSMESDVSSMVDEELPDFSQKISTASRGAEDPSSTQHPPRFSPNALERKMAAELNLLESMEESMRQITGVERSRAVSMAQQETVSLAQILKSRQQAHELEMKELQLKARQETAEASLQLEEVRKRAAEAAQNAAQMITMVRGGDASQSLHESRRRLIESQTEVAKATAEATRCLAEARGGVVGVGSDIGRKVKTSGKPGVEDRNPVLSSRSVSKSTVTSSFSRSSDEYDSMTKSPSITRSKARSSGSLISENVVTANDSMDHPLSSIRTASGAEAKDDSKSESIAEDLSYAKGSVDDYSMNFDESLTEDEVEEKSFRMVLPSESHRRKAKHQRSQSDVSVTSEDQSVASGKFGDDFSSLFIGEDSFNRFTTEMVSQYMREEELRAQHQASLLHLREKALREKTKAELAWLDQQKKRMRNKGSDDAYPQLKKRQRGIILKLEQEQAEIKRLQEANLAASKERQLILKQQQELQQLRKSTQNTWDKVQGVRPARGNQPFRAYHRREDVHTEDEVSLALEEGSDANITKKDIKSDSEIYTEPKQRKKSESKVMTKLKNVHLDQRYLTAREKKLRDRRKNAEQLLAWKKKLDDEEKKIYELEKQAIDLWEDGERKSGKRTSRSEKGTGKDATDGARDKRANKGKETERDISETQTSLPAQRSESESSISEAISRSQVSRSEISRSQASRSRTQSAKHPSSVAKRGEGQTEVSESEGSIQEEIQSQSSSNTEEASTTKKQARESVHDTIRTQSVADTYGDDSFVSADSVTPSKKKSPLHKLRTPPSGLLFDPSRSPLSPGRPFGYKRGSESESEDSLHAETASDQSDVEGRIRALKDQLQCRKLQFDRLKKESEKQQKEKLKTHEESLKKQIEAYDNSIKQMTVQLQNELEHEPVRTGKKPQIKHPRGRDSKQKATHEESSPQKPLPPQRSESESSRSSQSSSFEESRDSIDSSQTSPTSVTEGVLTSPSVYKKDSSVGGKKGSLLESISERSETPPSERVRRSLLGKDELSNVSASKAVGKTIDSKFSAEEAELALPIADDYNAVVLDAEKMIIPATSASKTLTFDTVPVSAGSNLTPRQQSFAGSELLSARSEISEYITENVPSQASAVSYSDDGLGFKPLGVLDTEKQVESKPADINDEASQAAEDEALKSDISKYSYSTTKSEKTLSEKSDVSYTEDFSEAETGVSERGKVSKSLGKEDTVLSDEEISEELSMVSDVSEKTSSAPLLDVLKTANKAGETKMDEVDEMVDEEKKAIIPDEEKTPVHSPRDTSANLEVTPAVLKEIQLEDSFDKPSPKLSQEGSKLDDDESLVTDSELDKVISSTAAAVEQFDSTPFSSPEHVPKSQAVSPASSKRLAASEKLVDSLTNGLMESVLKDSMTAMGQIAARRSPSKTPPPTRPKPKRDLATAPSDQPSTSPPAAGVSPSSPPPESRQNGSPAAEMQTDSVMSNMLNEAISEMITIRNKQRERSSSPKSPEDKIAGRTSPVDETSSLNKVTNGLQHEDISMTGGVPRPGSPLPGEKPIFSKEDISKLDDDLMNIYGAEDEYHDDDEWFHPTQVPNKPPPPYPGTADHQAHIPYEISRILQVEQPQYAVPHKKEDVCRIVGNAVEVYWMRRRYGEPLEGVTPPETYFSQEDNGIDMDSTSRRAYKTLLFDLAGEIIREVYKGEQEEEDDPPQPWKKPKCKQQKYYKGAEPPTTMDVLTKLVQDTAVIILGLNGTPRLDPRLNKWGSRKKKDNVDSILVEELHEEEPHWVNYDDDELAVKMQLTDTIFDSLLQDTVQTMNRVFRKWKSRTQEPG